jgi:phosphatidylserine decarboxylase
MSDPTDSLGPLVSDRMAVLPQYFIPKLALTRLMGELAGARGGALTTRVIRWFIERYRVDMAEAANPDPAAYATFNDFFTRALAPDARPLASADLVCPVDGAISQLGAIDGDAILQAKGHTYTVQALVGGDADLARRFLGGHFATLYLSPKDYHRIHMPCDGTLARMIHVPGELFSVCAQRARGLRVRQRAWTVRPRAGGRHHRRQHGHRLARRREPAAAGDGA